MIWATIWDFQQCVILTSVGSNEPVQPPFKLRNSKWCSVSSLTLIEYSSDWQRSRLIWGWSAGRTYHIYRNLMSRLNHHDPKIVLRNVDKHSVPFCGAMNILLFRGGVCQHAHLKVNCKGSLNMTSFLLSPITEILFLFEKRWHSLGSETIYCFIIGTRSMFIC